MAKRAHVRHPLWSAYFFAKGAAEMAAVPTAARSQDRRSDMDADLSGFVVRLHVKASPIDRRGSTGWWYGARRARPCPAIDSA